MELFNVVAAVPFGGRTYSSADERFAEQRRLVMLVVAAYRAVFDLSVVIALNLDEESRNRANRWSTESCHYKIDVENTVRRAIDAQPSTEHHALWKAWKSLLTDDAKVGKDEQRLIRMLAGPFYTKQLHPSLYFRPHRLTRKDAR